MERAEKLYCFVPIVSRFIIMAEVTIKLNKTTMFVVVAFLLGAVAGYFLRGANVGAKGYVLNQPNTQLVGQNQPSDDGLTEPVGSLQLRQDEHTRGAKKPQLTLVEFSDFQCPFCQRFHPTMQQVMRDYGDKVAWVYRHFPLSFHVNAQISAEASECAAEQNKFWEYADKLFEVAQSDGTGLAKADLKKYAAELGLNTSNFNSCLDSGKYTNKVNADLNEGTSVGVTGTPGTILIDKNGNTRLVSGAVPYEQIKGVIDAALQQ